MKLRITDLPRLVVLTDEVIKENSTDNNLFEWKKLNINQKYLPGLLSVYFPHSYRISFPYQEDPSELISLLESLDASAPYTFMAGGNSYYDVFFKDASDITFLSLNLA